MYYLDMMSLLVWRSVSILIINCSLKDWLLWPLLLVDSEFKEQAWFSGVYKVEMHFTSV